MVQSLALFLDPEAKMLNGLCNALFLHILTLPLLCVVHHACVS